MELTEEQKENLLFLASNEILPLIYKRRDIQQEKTTVDHFRDKLDRSTQRLHDLVVEEATLIDAVVSLIQLAELDFDGPYNSVDSLLAALKVEPDIDDNLPLLRELMTELMSRLP